MLRSSWLQKCLGAGSVSAFERESTWLRYGSIKNQISSLSRIVLILPAKVLLLQRRGLES